MSASRSATTVTCAADCSTCFACRAVSTQCTDSRSASGRRRCGIGFSPVRLHTSPPTRPRHDPLAASTASIAWTSTPWMLPCPIGPRPRRRCAVVGNFTSVLSWIASTCRPAQAAPVSVLHPATSFSAVTFGLAKNRPACNSPLRSPPSRPTGPAEGRPEDRLRHTVLRTTIRSRIAPPLIEAQISECLERPVHCGSPLAMAATHRIALAPRRASKIANSIRSRHYLCACPRAKAGTHRRTARTSDNRRESVMLRRGLPALAHRR